MVQHRCTILRYRPIASQKWLIAFPSLLKKELALLASSELVIMSLLLENKKKLYFNYFILTNQNEVFSKPMRNKLAGLIVHHCHEHNELFIVAIRFHHE